ncbi:phosphate transport system permease protein [Anseongella ginsenosidimutans]|uniref:Phosphate transport system permease protein PstA n=1 Tax=Anseongella ginsenosidimutans TaxID=496056 RepID=A0A4R3KPK3_9SPHI|nr:phosphate ABC transporter permease PstA [Anseongella ginsenosidimutans]QEC53650.1 phosphate ABC transporter permease PstA [Anseongella ginsenosidimutans]TCS86100.1 phosphate transport system permease protein [Anseongella ginsenosidimutans]
MRNRKKTEEWFFRNLMSAVTYFIILILLLIIWVVFQKGIPALSWEMVSQTPKGGFYFGKDGGLLNAIVGSLYLASGAASLAWLISLPTALFMNVYLVRYKKFLTGIRFLLDVLWGIPSIVYGAFGFALMIFFNLQTSLLAGIITVSLLIAPIMIRAMDEVLKTIPMGLLETAYSLGSTRTETAFVIFFRQALPGFITAFLLAFGRGIGDTASVLFTAGFTDYIPENLSQPAATLPLSIFFQLGSPIPEVRERAYAAAVILTVLILIISLAARLLPRNFKRNVI